MVNQRGTRIRIIEQTTTNLISRVRHRARGCSDSTPSIPRPAFIQAVESWLRGSCEKGIVSARAVRTVGHALTWLLLHSRNGQQANQQERGRVASAAGRGHNRSCSFAFVFDPTCRYSYSQLTAHFTASTPLVSRFADSDLDLRAPAHHTSQVAAAAAPSLDSTRTWERSTKSYEYGIWCQQRTARPLSIAETWSAVHNAGSVLGSVLRGPMTRTRTTHATVLPTESHRRRCWHEQRAREIGSVVSRHPVLSSSCTCIYPVSRRRINRFGLLTAYCARLGIQNPSSIHELSARVSGVSSW